MKINIDKAIRKKKGKKTTMFTARVRPETKKFFQRLDLDILKESIEEAK